MFFRVLRLINNAQFKKYVATIARKIHGYDFILKEFAGQLCYNINGSILNDIENYSDDNTVNVICTASLDDYIQIVAESLGFDFIATEVYGNNINHIYGLNKISELRNKYPPEEYFYNYAVSDNKNDIELLKLFNHYQLLKK